MRSKFRLYNKKKHMYFSHYEGNKPIWVKRAKDAGLFIYVRAAKYRHRLSFQSQTVRIIRIKEKK